MNTQPLCTESALEAKEGLLSPPTSTGADSVLSWAHPVSGIYIIENLRNGKKYIGLAGCLGRRLYHHRYYLENGIHKNTHLQGSYNKYGAGSFLFYVQEIVPISKMEEREEYWIKHFGTTDPLKGYNKTSGGERETPTAEVIALIAEKRKGYRHSESTRQKIRDSWIERRKRLQPRKVRQRLPREEYLRIKREVVLKTWAARREDGWISPLKGRKRKPMSDETKRKMSESRKGKKLSEEVRARMSMGHMGIRPTEETRKKMSAWQIGLKRPRNKTGQITKHTELADLQGHA